MALSNWLTRNEWNAAYFAYLVCVDFSENPDPQSFPFPVDLSTHLRVGICLVHQHGYTDWSGIAVPNPEDFNSVRKSEDTRYGVNACTAEGDNAGCLAEILEGKLDLKVRAGEVLVWLDQHPELNFEGLRLLCQHVVNPEDETAGDASD